MDDNLLYQTGQDELAIEAIFREYYKPLYHYAKKFIDQDEVADDLVQDVFYKLLRSKNTLSINTSLKSYLFTAVRNGCLNELAHNTVVKNAFTELEIELKKEEIAYFSTQHTSVIEKEVIEKLHEVVNNLPPVYRSVMQYKLKGMKSREIAAQLNLPVRTVETQVFRALKLIREQMSDCFLLAMLLMAVHIK